MKLSEVLTQGWVIAKNAFLKPLYPSNMLQCFLELWKTIHYPPETASIQLIVRLLATIVQAETKETRDSLSQKV